ncbi:MAG: hypothetical protein LBR25_01410, partial [Erysipelotrichaceae bacterium]|nr:hypothetical protein [Erysipelotrichaceae bacterium]
MLKRMNRTAFQKCFSALLCFVMLFGFFKPITVHAAGESITAHDAVLEVYPSSGIKNSVTSSELISLMGVELKSSSGSLLSTSNIVVNSSDLTAVNNLLKDWYDGTKSGRAGDYAWMKPINVTFYQKNNSSVATTVKLSFSQQGVLMPVPMPTVSIHNLLKGNYINNTFYLCSPSDELRLELWITFPDTASYKEVVLYLDEKNNHFADLFDIYGPIVTKVGSTDITDQGYTWENSPNNLRDSQGKVITTSEYVPSAGNMILNLSGRDDMDLISNKTVALIFSVKLKSGVDPTTVSSLKQTLNFVFGYGVITGTDTVNMYPFHTKIKNAGYNVTIEQITDVIEYKGLEYTTSQPSPKPETYARGTSQSIPVGNVNTISSDGKVFVGWTVEYANTSIPNITSPVKDYEVPAGTSKKVTLTAVWKDAIPAISDGAFTHDITDGNLNAEQVKTKGGITAEDVFGNAASLADIHLVSNGKLEALNTLIANHDTNSGVPVPVDYYFTDENDNVLENNRTVYGTVYVTLIDSSQPTINGGSFTHDIADGNLTFDDVKSLGAVSAQNSAGNNVAIEDIQIVDTDQLDAVNEKINNHDINGGVPMEVEIQYTDNGKTVTDSVWITLVDNTKPTITDGSFTHNIKDGELTADEVKEKGGITAYDIFGEEAAFADIQLVSDDELIILNEYIYNEITTEDSPLPVHYQYTDNGQTVIGTVYVTLIDPSEPTINGGEFTYDIANGNLTFDDVKTLGNVSAYGVDGDEALFSEILIVDSDQLDAVNEKINNHDTNSGIPLEVEIQYTNSGQTVKDVVKIILVDSSKPTITDGDFTHDIKDGSLTADEVKTSGGITAKDIFGEDVDLADIALVDNGKLEELNEKIANHDTNDGIALPVDYEYTDNGQTVQGTVYVTLTDSTEPSIQGGAFTHDIAQGNLTFDDVKNLGSVSAQDIFGSNVDIADIQIVDSNQLDAINEKINNHDTNGGIAMDVEISY